MPTPAQILTPEDSKRVADAMIAAIETARIDMTQRWESMCQQMATNHYYAEQQRVNTEPRFY